MEDIDKDKDGQISLEEYIGEWLFSLKLLSLRFTAGFHFKQIVLKKW